MQSINSYTVIIYMVLQISHFCDCTCTSYYVILEEIHIGPNVLLQTIPKKSLKWEKIIFPQNSTDTEECILDMECLGFETTCTDRPTTVKNYGVHEYLPDEIELFNNSDTRKAEIMKELQEVTRKNYITTTENEITSTYYVTEETSTLVYEETTLYDNITTVIESTTSDDYLESTVPESTTSNVNLTEDVIKVEREKLMRKNEHMLGNKEKQTKDRNDKSLTVILVAVAAILGSSVIILFGVRQLITCLQSGTYRFPDPPPQNDEEEMLTDMITSV